MRRSIRDALVGFSLVGAAVTFTATNLWMRGVRLGSTSWEVTASFPDASGLSERSAVTYRGIVVGSVSNIDVTPEAVLATLEINHSELRLPLPVFANVSRGSLLGGEAQVALISLGTSMLPNSPTPLSPDCLGKNVLCNGQTILGEPAASLSSVARTFDRLLQQAEKKELIKNLDDLILQLRQEVARAVPTIENLNEATQHINNLVSALDNPKTISELQETVSTAHSLTEKIDAVGGDIESLTADPDFMNAVRSVTIGLGELFNELYPIRTQSTR